MNRFFVLCFVVAVSVSEGLSASLRNKRQVIPREFQNINIENYLKNERAVRFQLKCIIDDGPCDRIGKYLKVTIPELLVNQCANCDMAQRERAGKLVSHIQQNFPEEWERAVKKFQGGLVKPDDAARLESILGVKLSPNLVGEVSTTTTTTTAAPAPSSTPEAKAAEVPSTSPVPVSTSSSSAAPPASSSSEAPAATSSAAPASAPAAIASSSIAPETSSVAAAVSEASTTQAAVAAPSSTTQAAAVSSSTSEASSTVAAVASSSAAPAA